jgi:3-deoxy-D-manno-octulosonic-acid transferase
MYYYLLYNILILFLFPILFPLVLLKTKSKEELKQRLGFYDKDYNNNAVKSKIWIHAASVGETNAGLLIAKAFIKLVPDCSIIFSTMTVTGQNLAKEKILSDKNLSSKITFIYAPLDFLFSVKKAIKTFKPDILVLIETEIWPNLIKEAKKSGVKTAILNGRISSKYLKRYIFIKSLLKYLFKDIDIFSMIKKEDAEGIKLLGADTKKIKISGNVKFDISYYQQNQIDINYFEKIFNISKNTPVFVAGSTRFKEHDVILNVYEKIIKTLPEAILIIAPRHIERTSYIYNLLKKKNISCQLRSEIKDKRKAQIVILDTIGELSIIYEIATIAFCGGTLEPFGGHNILEPVICGKPVCYGPFTDNFADARKLIENTEGGIEVKNKEELYEKVIYFLQHKDKAKKAGAEAKAELSSHIGAAEKHVNSLIGLSLL